ncbi:MAG: ATP-binding protein [Candidatus Thiodiazotropha sp.]
MSFRSKIMLGFSLIVGLMLAIQFILGMNLFRDSHYEALSKRASSVALLFATASNDAILSSDLSTLECIIDEVMKNPGIVYAQILDRNNQIMAQRGDTPLLLKGKDPGLIDDNNSKIHEAEEDIIESGVYYGQVKIGISDPRIQEIIDEAKSGAYLLATIEIAMIFVFAYFLGELLSKQIKALDDGSRLVCNGALGYQIPVRGNDELARTSESFNTMSSKLKQLYRELDTKNTLLRHKVDERSNELKLLYRVSSILVDLETPIEEQLQSIIDTIDQLLPESDFTVFKIVYEENQYSSSRSLDVASDCLTRNLIVNSKIVGFLEMCCSSEQPDNHNDDFRVRKEPLIGAICQAISTSIAHRHALQERQLIEVQLRQAQKLESVGQLAAGIAHEINTPTQFVNDNTVFLKDAFTDLNKLFVKYTELASQSLHDDGLTSEIKMLEQDIDIDYLMQEIPQAIDQSIEGLQRISKIVRAMKQFSHPGGDNKAPADINSAIETTIDVSRNEWKYVAEMVTDFDTNLTQVPIYQDEFNQVILNMIVNAAHAIEDAHRNQGIINITTSQDTDNAIVRVQDNGAGIPDSIIQRIFDPFFTTKEVGRGSGQGLAIAYSVIVDKHGGMIDVESSAGTGTVFTIKLPLKTDTNTPS